jgi:hypothetical protein
MKMHSFLGHMELTIRGELRGGFVQAKCGYKSQIGGNITRVDPKVTCKKCLKIMEAKSHD